MCPARGLSCGAPDPTFSLSPTCAPPPPTYPAATAPLPRGGGHPPPSNASLVQGMWPMPQPALRMHTPCEGPAVQTTARVFFFVVCPGAGRVQQPVRGYTVTSAWTVGPEPCTASINGTCLRLRRPSVRIGGASVEAAVGQGSPLSDGVSTPGAMASSGRSEAATGLQAGHKALHTCTSWGAYCSGVRQFNHFSCGHDGVAVALAQKPSLSLHVTVQVRRSEGRSGQVQRGGGRRSEGRSGQVQRGGGGGAQRVGQVKSKGGGGRRSEGRPGQVQRGGGEALRG